MYVNVIAVHQRVFENLLSVVNQSIKNDINQPGQDQSVGDYILVLYKGVNFKEIVEALSERGVIVSAMERSGCNLKWPMKKM